MARGTGFWKVIEGHLQLIAVFLIKRQRLETHSVHQRMQASSLTRRLFSGLHQLCAVTAFTQRVMHPQEINAQPFAFDFTDQPAQYFIVLIAPVHRQVAKIGGPQELAIVGAQSNKQSILIVLDRKSVV